MNYMPEVLKMLGIEVGEKFYILGSLMSPFSFNANYQLIDKDGDITNDRIKGLLTGESAIEKLPWKPNEDDPYFFVMASGSINESSWSGHVVDYSLFNTNNCFRTSEEITPEIKKRILREMKEKYENE